MIEAVKEIWENRQTLWCQFYVNIKTTVVTTKLGALWWILDPLIFMAIYYFVICIVFSRGGPGYHLFALCGIVTWQSFTRSVSLSASALVNSAGLIKQISLPMFLYVIISPIVQAFFYIIGLLLIIVWNSQVIGLHTLSIFILVFLMIIMASAFGLFLSIFQVYMADTARFVRYSLRFGFYMSPVLYSAERIYAHEGIPSWAKFLYSMNPMVHFIEAVRDLLLDGKMFNYYNIGILFIITFCVIQIGLIFFRKISPNIPKML